MLQRLQGLVLRNDLVFKACHDDAGQKPKESTKEPAQETAPFSDDSTATAVVAMLYQQAKEIDEASFTTTDDDEEDFLSLRPVAGPTVIRRRKKPSL